MNNVHSKVRDQILREAERQTWGQVSLLAWRDMEPEWLRAWNEVLYRVPSQPRLNAWARRRTYVWHRVPDQVWTEARQACTEE